MAKRSEDNTLKIDKPAKICLPGGIEVRVGVWMGKDKRKHCSVYVRCGNAQIGLDKGGVMQLNWEVSKKYYGIETETIHLPMDITAVYFDPKKGKLFKIKKVAPKESPRGKI